MYSLLRNSLKLLLPLTASSAQPWLGRPDATACTPLVTSNVTQPECHGAAASASYDSERSDPTAVAPVPTQGTPARRWLQVTSLSTHADSKGRSRYVWL